MATKLVSPKTQAANPTKYSTSQVSTALTGGLQKKPTVPTTKTTQAPQTAPQKFAEAREQSKAQGTQISTGKGYFDSGSYKVGTPTVISNKTIVGQIPKDIAKLDQLSQKGEVSNGEAVYYPDGTMKPIESKFGKEDYESTPEYKLLEQMKSSLDASTSSQIGQIQKQLQLRRDETNAIAKTQAKSMENSLLMGGATGSGSSAQYAPISSEGIMSAQENYRMKQIQELDNQEMQLIQAARAAQESGNFQILSQQIKLIGELREKKQEETARLNETITEQNNKLREQVYQQQKDQSISELYKQGITDVASIVEATGLPSKEVAETLKNLVPVGLDDLVESLRNNGAPSSVMQKVINSKNLSEAYMNAGSWGAEGSGKVAEYNLYKAQAEDSGVTPMGYQGWIDYNENQQLARQKALKGTLTGAQKSGGSSSGVPVKTGASQTVASSDPFVQKLLSTKGGGKVTDTTIQKLDKGLSVLGQLGVLQENIKGVSTGPIIGAFKDKNPWDNKAQVIKAQLNAIIPNLARGIYGEVGVLTDNDIAQYSKTIPNLKSTEEVRDAVMYITLDMIGKSIKNTLNVNASANRDVSGFVDIYQEMEATKNSILQTIPGANVPQSIKQDSNNQLINQQKQSTQEMDQIYTTLAPKYQDIVDGLYLKDYNDIQVVEYLKLKGIIK